MATSRIGSYSLVILDSCLLAGCIAQGAIYSRTTQPLMTDFQSTPVGDAGSKGDVKTVAFYVDVEWGDGGIGDIARQKGIAETYYADVERVTVLSYWKQDFVRVYGRADDAPAPSVAVTSAARAEQDTGLAPGTILSGP